MFLSRRQFVLGSVALPLAPWRRLLPTVHGREGASPVASASDQRPSGTEAFCCLLLDGGGHTVLDESLRGYRSALAALGARVAQTSVSEVFGSWVASTAAGWDAGAAARHAPGSTLIVAPAALLRPRSAEWLRQQACSGATVVFESAAAFAGPEEFRAQSRLIRSALGVTIEAGCDWWHPSPASREMPYVRYRWPVGATVRDFTRAVTVADAETIACVRGQPVALRKRVGRGTLVFLGSPLGPHLLSRDPDATRWFASLLITINSRGIAGGRGRL